MKNLKLTIELLPKGAWGNDLSRTLPKEDWDALRNFCFQKANYKCQICGTNTEDLTAHEVWNFDVEKREQTLIDIIALCNKCHGVKHFRNSERLGFGENAKTHFLSVNKCDELEFSSHYAKALLDFNQRNSVYFWKMKVDLSNFGGQDIQYKQEYREQILNPYNEDELESLYNDTSLNPRILNINVNNYNGSINVLCDQVNKIEWISEKQVVETKFNFCRRFKTSFIVKGKNMSELYFRLSNLNGQKISKKFKFTD